MNLIPFFDTNFNLIDTGFEKQKELKAPIFSNLDQKEIFFNHSP